MNLEQGRSLTCISNPHDKREEQVMRTTSEIEIRELDRRSNNGIDVTLLWSPHANRVFVAVEDEPSGESFSVDVDGAHALDAFHHPYAYAGRAQPDYAFAA
jgi:hypothetical protein